MSLNTPVQTKYHISVFSVHHGIGLEAALEISMKPHSYVNSVLLFKFAPRRIEGDSQVIQTENGCICRACQFAE